MKKYIYLFVILTMVFSSCETEEPIPTYTLSTTVSPTEGGKITVSPQSPNYKEGEMITLTPEPNEHWVFQKWDGDGSGSSTPLQITMTSDKSVVGVFVKRDYPLTLTIEGEGTVEEKIVTNPGGREYPHGTTVELTPVPKEGWVFESWGGDLTGTESPKTITVDKEKKVTVKFVKPSPIFRLGDNGITCICENVNPGDKGFINGVEFESVDNDLLIKRRDGEKDLSKVCTSLVTDMRYLFEKSDFNQPIGNWDVSNVMNMRNMFDNSKFNQSIEYWDISNVTNMSEMFVRSPFNQPIGNWDVGKVTEMIGMFNGTPFNQPIGNWDVSNVTNMSGMFVFSKFNQPIGNWDVGKVTSMGSMFVGSQFNQPIGNWDVSNVTNMGNMFSSSQFNQPIANWKVSNVSVMSGMFSGTPFNQPIGNWDVSNVTNMNGMFSGTPFNQPIGNWDVGIVTNMGNMFGFSSFNRNISKWCVTIIKTEPQGFSQNSPLTSDNKPKWGTCPD